MGGEIGGGRAPHAFLLLGSAEPERKMKTLNENEKAYIAGFIDGDGCILSQIIPRKDYVYKFQIRVSVTFYQKKNRH